MWGRETRKAFSRAFRREVERGLVEGELRSGDTLLVALSGGLDSLVLLHALRFDPELPSFRVLAAHFDHRMRSGSAEDALWVRGLCRAWGVPLRCEAAAAVPSSEEEARSARYDVLLRVREETDARWVLTAHHADDQAETVLFRASRGTGLRGLAGIPRRRSPGILRLLLPFSREELERYACSVGIRPREDPTNRDLSLARNFIRHVTLPGLESHVAPGARKSLVRLARLARENEVAWESLLPELLDPLLEVGERGVFVVRSGLLAYHPTVQARLLRELLRRSGVRWTEAGTRALLEFTRTGASGRSVPVPGGLRLHREFDRFLLGPDEEKDGACRAVLVPDARDGRGDLVLGGERRDVVWGEAEPTEMVNVARFSRDSLEFPLLFRGWMQGDRIRLPYGTKKLKKLLQEAGIAAGERDRVPVLVDASGRLLWVVGVADSHRTPAEAGEALFFIGTSDVHQS